MDIKQAELIFSDNINCIRKASIITADSAISSLLSAITGIPQLFEVLKECNRDFDFKSSFHSAVNSDRMGSMVLPNGKRQTVALVTGILICFDRHELPIVDFIMTRFPSESHTTSYSRFLQEVIGPYEKAFLECMSKGAVAIDEAVSDEVAPVTNFPDNAQEDVSFYLSALREDIVGANLSDAARAELSTVVGGMEYIIETKNPLLIKVGFIGLRNSFSLYDVNTRQIAGIAEVLRLYGVL